MRRRIHTHSHALGFLALICKPKYNFCVLTGDSLSYHDEMAFSTEDSDNDLHRRNCAVDNKGGWWYHSCYSSNLNGIYHTGWYSQVLTPLLEVIPGFKATFFFYNGWLLSTTWATLWVDNNAVVPDCLHTE